MSSTHIQRTYNTRKMLYNKKAEYNIVKEATISDINQPGQLYKLTPEQFQKYCLEEFNKETYSIQGAVEYKRRP